MEKALTFSKEEKSLIWSRFIQPANGSQDEAQHFIQVCEKFGLNPLLGDIVFQRYETRNGARTQFITTRDGLLRVATTQPGYVGPPNANVVKEGDYFEFLPAEGTVKHQFGSKRGKILGAYAIMQHKKHNPVAVFVDFNEYYQANSGKLNSRYGNPNVWDRLPSAMIVKIAEVFVLRRQFPLGGLYTHEEIGLEEDVQAPIEQPTQSVPTTDSVKNNQFQQNQHKPQSEQQQHPKKETINKKHNTQIMEVVLKAFDVKESASGKQYGLCDVFDEESNKTFNLLVKNKEDIKNIKNIPLETNLVVSIYKENGFVFLDGIKNNANAQAKAAESNHNVERKTNESQQEQQSNDYEVVRGILKNKQSGKKGQTKFVKMAFQTNEGEILALLAHGNQNVYQAENLQNGQQVSIRVKKENGFNFFVGVHSTEMENKVG